MPSDIRSSARLATRRAPSTGAVRGFGAFGAGAWTHACERSRCLHSRFDAFSSVGTGAERRRHGPRGPSEGPFDDARVMSLRRREGSPPRTVLEHLLSRWRPACGVWRPRRLVRRYRRVLRMPGAAAKRALGFRRRGAWIRPVGRTGFEIALEGPGRPASSARRHEAVAHEESPRFFDHTAAPF
jgi:hypothetical protein